MGRSKSSRTSLKLFREKSSKRSWPRLTRRARRSRRWSRTQTSRSRMRPEFSKIRRASSRSASRKRGSRGPSTAMCSPNCRSLSVNSRNGKLPSTRCPPSKRSCTIRWLLARKWSTALKNCPSRPWLPRARSFRSSSTAPSPSASTGRSCSRYRRRAGKF